MKVKKYHSYKLCITTQDKKDFIKLNGNINQTSYATMVKYYHKTKDKYQNEDCTIELVGVHENGTVGSVIFSKTFCKEVKEDKELLMGVDEIVENIQGLLGLLERKKCYHSDMIAALNKKQDLLLHKIESIGSFEGTKEQKRDEKLKIMDSLEETRHDRRFNKNEQLKLNIVNSIVDIEVLKKHFDEIKIPIEPEKYEYINGELQDRIVKEIKYNSLAQRDNTLKGIRHKYDRIVDDTPRKILICYNKNYYKNNK